MDLYIAIEHGSTGICYGRFVEYIGTHARAFDKATLFEELKKELEYHLQWMRIHDLNPPEVLSPVLITIEEQHDIGELGTSGGEVAFFEFDKQVVSDDFLETIIHYMTLQRNDLLKLVKSLPVSKLEFTPSGKGRNIVQILMHICNAEEWYISRMGAKATEIYLENAGIPESELDNLSTFERLESVRKSCIETLREIVPRFNLKVFKRPEFTNYPDEKWTSYKVLRRFLEHEREHYYNIKEYLSILPRSFA